MQMKCKNLERLWCVLIFFVSLQKIRNYTLMNTNFKLRELHLSDAASFAENINNPNIYDNLRDALPKPYSEADGKAFIEMVLSQPKPATILVIEVDGKAVGCIGVTLRTDVERISAEIGYWLGENYWNKGIMTEVIKQMATYAFANFPHLRKIYATPFDFNTASHRVLEKAGFEREAILKQAAIKNEKIVGMYYYSLFRKD